MSVAFWVCVWSVSCICLFIYLSVYMFIAYVMVFLYIRLIRVSLPPTRTARVEITPTLTLKPCVDGKLDGTLFLSGVVEWC